MFTARPSNANLGDTAKDRGYKPSQGVDEEEPLLAASNEVVANDESDRTPGKISYKDLPKKGQLAIICLARIADPLAASSIQTYIYYQLKHFNPETLDATISVQVGIVAGGRMAAHVCSGLLWGHLADADWGGRKAVLVFGLLSSSVTSIGYGFSTTFLSAVLWQVFGGLMASNISITRCIVAEMFPEKQLRTRALMLLPLVSNIGLFIGPLLGGLLTSDRDDGRFISRYPFALPNVCIAVLYFVMALGIMFYVDETLESLQHDKRGLMDRLSHNLKNTFKGFLRTNQDAHNHNSAGDSSTTVQEDLHRQEMVQKRKLPFRSIWTPNVLLTMLSIFIIVGQLGAFNTLWAVFLSTSSLDRSQQHPPFHFGGGLGMHPAKIGLSLSIVQAIGVLIQVVLYPTLNDHFGTVRVWRGALYILPITYLLAPFPALVASYGDKISLWASFLGVMLLASIARTGISPATTLLINDCTPHPSVRGTVHTAGTVMGALGRSVFPVAASMAFGQGLRIHVVGLGFWLLSGLAIIACVVSQWVKEGTNGKDFVLEDETSDNLHVN